MQELADFTEALMAAKRAAMEDSNDEEIQALQDALEVACDLLGVNYEDPEVLVK